VKNLLLIFFVSIVILTSCQPIFDKGELENVGLILEGTIHDETWGRGAYLGVLNIKDHHNVSVLLKENINTFRQVEETVKDFDRQGVNLVFGHGDLYGKYFSELNENYPHIHFVYFNGQIFDRNLTSIHFNGYEMGYFSGLLAAKMTETKKIGIIPAFSTQSEVEGFYEGIKSVDPTIQVLIRSVQDWYDQQLAMKYFHELLEQGIDVVYPAGDGFNVPIIQDANKNNIYAIGYINDQYEVARETVITSTVQRLEDLYLEVANQYDEGDLPSGIINFSFDGEYIYLGTFGDSVPKEIQEEITSKINRFIQTGKLRNEY